MRDFTKSMSMVAGATLLTLGAAGSAHAQDFNGAQLSGFCQSERDKVKTTTCFAFIKGSVDTYLILTRVGAIAKPVACLPANVSVDLLRRAYVAWSRKNGPAAQRHSAADALMVSWRTSFPCGKK